MENNVIRGCGTNGSGSEEEFAEVYARINPETLDEFRALNPDVKVCFWWMGGRRYPCAVYRVPRAFAEFYGRMERNEAIEEQQNARCFRQGCGGKMVRCDPKRYKCRDCEYVLSSGRGVVAPGYYDAFLYAEMSDSIKDNPPDPAVSSEVESAVCRLDEETVDRFVEILVQHLVKKRSKYGPIFRKLLDGVVSPSQIAEDLGLGKSQTYTDVAAVREAVKKLYFRLLEE